MKVQAVNLFTKDKLRCFGLVMVISSLECFYLEFFLSRQMFLHLCDLERTNSKTKERFSQGHGEVFTPSSVCLSLRSEE